MRKSKLLSQSLNFNITRNLRIAAFFFFMMVFIVGMILGTFASMSLSDAEASVSNIENLWNQPLASFIASVLLNDVELCLPMFIPVFGQVFLVIIGYNTGVVLSAYAIVQSINRVTVLRNILFYPTTLLDCMVFGLAASEGFIFLLSIIKRSYVAEGKRLIIAMIVCIAVLAVSEVLLVLTRGAVIRNPLVPFIPPFNPT